MRSVFGPLLAIILLIPTFALLGQQTPAQPAQSEPDQTAAAPDQAPTAPAGTVTSQSKLLIGTGDELEISVYGVPDLTQKVRVNSDGDVSLALIGGVRVAGLSADEAQQAIEQRYVSGDLLKNPHVTVYVKEYTSQVVSISGEVQKPGLYPVVNTRRLFDMVMVAGGFTPKAGKTIYINHAQPNRAPTVVTLSDDPNKSTGLNALVEPGDRIMVSKAGIVYVLGEVTRAGGFVMEDRQPMSVLQAVALAAGPTRVAALNHTRLLRRTQNGLQETEIPLKKILQAKAPDIPMQADDILFVPGSTGKIAFHNSGSLATAAAAAAIYRF